MPEPPGYQYIKAGVTLSNLSPVSQRQANLFAPRDMDSEEWLYSGFYGINKNLGTDTVTHLASSIKKCWSMIRSDRSPRYTTSWRELPIARIG